MASSSWLFLSKLFSDPDAMQTVKFNRKAVAALAGVVFLLLCVVSYSFPGTSSEPPKVRHLENRQLAEKAEETDFSRRKATVKVCFTLFHS